MLLRDEEQFGPAAQAMVDRHLAPRGIDDARVLEAMRTIPRHVFVNPGDDDRAYADAALPTQADQTISQPYIVAAMTQLLRIAPTHRVLEIGTGSGYQTAILAQLAGEVVTIERDADLAARAAGTLAEFGYQNVRIEVGDGTLGFPGAAPYDRILVTAGAPETPPALIEQLGEGGRLVIPIGGRDEQVLTTVIKEGGEVRHVREFACRFVPLTGAQGW